LIQIKIHSYFDMLHLVHMAPAAAPVRGRNPVSRDVTAIANAMQDILDYFNSTNQGQSGILMKVRSAGGWRFPASETEPG
jgi:hypothetical protein